jgi:hypothetical protein
VLTSVPNPLQTIRIPKVKVHGPFEGDCGSIIFHDLGGDKLFTLYDARERLVASGGSARALADHAFRHGALTVLWDFNTRADEP